MVIPMQCCAMLCCCVCICDLTSPLPCYCSADRCCPTLHSHNPCDPNLHCPCGARCHLFINVTGLFFSFSIFPLHPLPPLFFCSLPVGHFSWSLPFQCSVMGLKDYQPQSRVKYHGSPWLIASACQPAGGSGKPHRKTDREIEQASKRERVDLILGYFWLVIAFMLQYCMFCSIKCHVRTYAGSAVLIWCECQWW